MKRILPILLALCFLVSNPLQAREKSSSGLKKSEIKAAQTLVKKMFHAIEKADLEDVRSLMTPERFGAIEEILGNKGQDWNDWFDFWKQYKLVEVREPVEREEKGEYWIEVDYEGIPGDRIDIVKERGNWYWDEN